MCSNTECITPFIKQTWVASSVFIVMFGQGMTLGYISCLLLALEKPDSPFKVDIAGMSWLASSVGLSSLIGILASCFLMDRIGRRSTFLLFVPTGAVAWLIISMAEYYLMLLIAAILIGISNGSTTMVGILVLAEYTAPRYRGSFLNFKTAMYCMGSTIVHILGKYVDWRTLAMLAMIPYIAAFVIAYTWPESPSWLVSKNLFQKSEEAFFWLRGTDDLSKWEIRSMITAQKERLMKHIERKSIIKKMLELLKKFKRKDFLKPVLVSCMAFMLLESTMRTVYPAYALQIMAEIAGTLPFYYTLCIDLIIMFSSIFSSVLVKMMRRRTLLFSSGISSLTVLLMACTYLIMVSNNILSKDRPWIGFTLFAVYFTLVNFGCVSLPLSLHGEIFPLPHREFGTAVTGLIKSGLITVYLKITPYLLESLKVYGTFLVFGSLMGVAIIVMYFILPETKDRTLQEIEDYFNRGKFETELIDYDDNTHVNILRHELNLREHSDV